MKFISAILIIAALLVSGKFEEICLTCGSPDYNWAKLNQCDDFSLFLKNEPTCLKLMQNKILKLKGSQSFSYHLKGSHLQDYRSTLLGFFLLSWLEDTEAFKATNCNCILMECILIFLMNFRNGLCSNRSSEKYFALSLSIFKYL